MTSYPAALSWQKVREATPWGRQPRYLVRDRDAVYGGDFARRAGCLGIQTLLSPARAPRANAIAERVIRTLRNECLDRLIILNEQHLRAVLAEFVWYYNTERPHLSRLLDSPVRRSSRGRSGPLKTYCRWPALCLRACRLSFVQFFSSYTPAVRGKCGPIAWMPSSGKTPVSNWLSRPCWMKLSSAPHAAG